jgi:hypothetical protein
MRPVPSDRFLFHFDFATWARMLRLAWRDPNPRNRRKLLFSLLVTVPVVATLDVLCFALDPLLFPSLGATKIEKPVFILGHARSGTTLLHRLMSADGDRFSAFRLYELFLPSLLQKRIVRALGAFDRRWVGGAIERRVLAWEDRRFGKTRHVHAMSLFAPEEDDGVLTYSCASGAWIVRLPYLGELDFYHVDTLPVRKRRRIMRFYAECVRRQLCANGADKTHLSKNPIFAGRVESLLETFPDARIVVPFRHPYETIPSLLELMRLAWKMRRWTDAEMERSLRVLAEQSFHTYRYPLEVLARHPETPHAIVDYAKLVAEPKRVVEEVYAALGIEVTEAFARTLDAEQERARKHETAHRYSLDAFGLQAGEIHARLADLFERFGWDPTRSSQPGSSGSSESPSASR